MDYKINIQIKKERKSLLQSVHKCFLQAYTKLENISLNSCLVIVYIYKSQYGFIKKNDGFGLITIQYDFKYN